MHANGWLRIIRIESIRKESFILKIDFCLSQLANKLYNNIQIAFLLLGTLSLTILLLVLQKLCVWLLVRWFSPYCLLFCQLVTFIQLEKKGPTIACPGSHRDAKLNNFT